MASDGSKPTTRGKATVKTALPGLPGSTEPSARAITAAAPDADALPPLALPEPLIPAVDPVAEAIADPVAAEPAAPEPVLTNPQPAAPVFSAAIVQKEEIMEATMQEAANKTHAMFGDVNEHAKSAMEKSSKMFEEMNAFGKGNVEAMVESSKIAAKGLEMLGQEAAEYTRKQFETTTAMMKSMASVKSPAELFKMQSDFIRHSFDSMVAESSKHTEAMLKLVGEIAQPLSNRVAIAADKAKTAA